MRFEDIPMPDERVVRLADASRTLFVQQRQMRDRLAARAGLSAVEYTAVMGVTDAGGMTPKQLAASLGLTTSAVTTLLDRLEAMDLLHRRPHPHDRRSVLVAASDKAERLAEEILEGYMRSVACVLDTLDGDADVDRIVRTMARLAQVSKTVGVDTACTAGEARATA